MPARPRLHRQVGDDTRERVVHPSACPPLRTLGLNLCGLSDARHGFSFVRSAWPHTQILACVGGSGEVLVDGRWQPCDAGMAYLTPPEVLHAYRCPRGGSWQVAWAIYEPDRAPVVGPAPRQATVDSAGLQAAVQGLHREAVGHAGPAELAAWAGLVDLLARRATEDEDRLATLWRAVSDDPARPWTLQALAKLAGVGPERLRRLCLARTGHPPMEEVTRLRMRHATLLLAGGRLSVAAVAAATGYANAFAFSTAFRRSCGVPPTSWQRQLTGR
jgi:AraC-like DNA-binding protein